MKKFALNNYFDKLCRKAAEETELYILTGEEQSLHKLRVTLKKTDTLLLILRFADENFDYEKYRYPLKRVFNHAGLIREAQMMQTKLEQLPDPANLMEVLNRFEDIKNTERALFVFKAGIYLRGLKKEKKNLEGKMKKVGSKEIKMFIKYQVRRLQHKIKAGNRSELHTIRKKIKRMLYANEFLLEINAKTMLSEGVMQQWDVLQDAIGQWHDRLGLFTYLEENYQLPEASIEEQRKELDRDCAHLADLLKIRIKMLSSGIKQELIREALD